MSEIQEQSFWEKTKRFLEPAYKQKLVTIRQFLYYSLEGFFGVSFVFFVKHLVEALEQNNSELFYQLLVMYGGVFLFLFLCVYFLHTAWAYTYNRYREIIENKYIPQFITFDMNTYEKVGTGKSIAIISGAIMKWGALLDKLVQNIAYFGVSIALTLYLLSSLHFSVVLIFIFLLVIGNIIGLYLNSKVLDKRKKRIELQNQWSRKMVQIMMSKMEILQSKKIDTELESLHENHEGQIYYNKQMSPFLVSFFLLGFIIVILLLYVIFIYFGDKYFNGEIQLGLIVGLSGAILLMEKVFINTLDFIKNFTKEFSEVQIMWDFFDTTPQIQGYEEGHTFQHQKGDIQLEKISYGYDANKPVFQDFSLKIPGEQITAFVGPSGGGKSTLVKLIAGYIRPDRGEVIVDTQKLSETSLKSYYQDIGYLTQEPSVFDGTVRENLLYGVSSPHLTSPKGRGIKGENLEEKMQLLSPLGREDSGVRAGEEQEKHFNKHLKKIITLANCEFIYDLPQGLDTEIGERGVKLSGGQKQRLAIAKIFLKNPKIIILDEPTSALDSLSEKKITEAMHNLFENRTVLVIAHRLQTVKQADDIVVIQDGKVIERGTHTQLVKNKGFYKQMLDLQSGF